MDFVSCLETIKQLVYKHNLKSENYPAIHLKYASDLKADLSCIAIIIGEQHFGSNFRNLNYSQTNRSITNLIIELFNTDDLALDACCKEGLSPLLINRSQNLSKEQLLINNHSPLEVISHAVDINFNKDIVINVVEDYSAFMRFALLSLLYCSLPNKSRYPEIELERVSEIIRTNLQFGDQASLVNIFEELSQKFELYSQNKLIKKSSLEIDDKKINVLLARFLNQEQITLNQKLLQELELNLLHLMEKAMQERDRSIVKNIIQLEQKIKLVVVGDLHIRNLKDFLEDSGAAVIVLSPFV